MDTRCDDDIRKSRNTFVLCVWDPTAGTDHFLLWLELRFRKHHERNGCSSNTSYKNKILNHHKFFLHPSSSSSVRAPRCHGAEPPSVSALHYDVKTALQLF